MYGRYDSKVQGGIVSRGLAVRSGRQEYRHYCERCAEGSKLKVKFDDSKQTKICSSANIKWISEDDESVNAAKERAVGKEIEGQT